jgi:hypothetical protein
VDIPPLLLFLTKLFVNVIWTTAAWAVVAVAAAMTPGIHLAPSDVFVFDFILYIFLFCFAPSDAYRRK